MAAPKQTPAPSNINNRAEHGCLEVVWPSCVVNIPLRRLRDACACAHCVHELTGEKLVKLTDIPEDIQIQKMELVGAYALRVKWSDGHDTGLFTWEKLAAFADGSVDVE